MRKPIIVVEGPAGSGKSTLCRSLETNLGLRVVARSLPSRSPDPTDAIMQSAVNDYSKFMIGFSSNRDSVIDRLVVSQHVYGTLRRSQIPGQKYRGASRAIFAFEDLIKASLSDLEARGLEDIPMPRILLVVLLPPLHVLEAQREKTDREFPWTGQRELLEYGAAVDSIRGSITRYLYFDELLIHGDPLNGSLLDRIALFIKRNGG